MRLLADEPLLSAMPMNLQASARCNQTTASVDSVSATKTSPPNRKKTLETEQAIVLGRNHWIQVVPR